MKHFKSLKPIAWNLSVQGSNITITDTIVDAYSTSAGFPFNTDGIGVSASDVVISNSVIYNGDDAIAIGSGAHNVLFQKAAIGYQTHGMSIGSLGSNQAQFANVSNIHFDDVTVAGGVYGARFKSWIGGQVRLLARIELAIERGTDSSQGLAKNVTWSNIRVYNVTFPIFVTQTYFNQGSSSTPRPNNSSVNMEDFTFENFAGTIDTFSPGDGSCASNVSCRSMGAPIKAGMPNN